MTTKSEKKSAEKPLFSGQNHPKKRAKISVVEQWIEVRIVDGKTVTTLYPSNQQLVSDGKKMQPGPTMVYRRFHFPDGVPPEYFWTCPDDPERRTLGGCGIQRMTVDVWLKLITQEANNEEGHLGPTGVGNLPRPKERGSCDCLVCSDNRDMLEPDQVPDDELDPSIPEPGSAWRRSRSGK